MHVFLTGPVQIGKSTLIAAALEQLRPERLGGFRTVSAKPEADGSRPVYLHPAAAQDLYKTLSYLNQKEGMAIVMVTHDLKAALKSARTVLHIGRNGLFSGSVPAYLASPQGRRFREDVES